MKIDDVKRILVIGAGTMGHQIGFLCAMHGYDVVVYDVNDDFLAAAVDERMREAAAVGGKLGADRIALAHGDQGEGEREEAFAAFRRAWDPAGPNGIRAGLQNKSTRPICSAPMPAATWRGFSPRGWKTRSLKLMN